MSERATCVYIGYCECGCGRRVESLDYGEDFGIPEAVARWSTWRCLPREAQCPGCVAYLDTPHGQKRLEPFQGEPTCASRADMLSVAIFCGAIAGAIPPDARDVIADYIAHGDPSPLLDLAEQRGLHEGGYGPERYEEWPEATEHVHVWLPWESGDAERTLGVFPGFRDASRFRRCTCGVFEHETGRDGLPICTGCQSTIDPEMCHCGSPCNEHDGWDGHAPVPMGCVCHLEADPDDVADLLDESVAMDDVARDVEL